MQQERASAGVGFGVGVGVGVGTCFRVGAKAGAGAADLPGSPLTNQQPPPRKDEEGVPREVAVAVQQIVPKIQRDLNCLADPDRQTRRKGGAQ